MAGHFVEPLSGRTAERDQHQKQSAYTEMQPTPVQPHLAHCCDCEKLELAGALDRQRWDNARSTREQEECTVQIAMQAAQRLLEHAGINAGVKESAEKLLTTAFDRCRARIASSGLPQL